MHNECLEIVHSIAEQQHIACTKVEHLLVDWVDLGREYNQVGIYKTTCTIFDFCRGLLKCTQAVAQGVLEGTVQTIEDCATFIAHPIQTSNDFIEGLAHTAYYFNILVHELSNLAHVNMATHFEYPIDFQRRAQADLFIAQCNMIINSTATYLSENPYDALKDGVKNITQMYLTGKALGITQKFITQAVAQAPEYLDRINHSIDGLNLLDNDTFARTANGAVALVVAEFGIIQKIGTVANVLEDIPAATVFCAMNLPKDIIKAIRDIRYDNTDGSNYDPHNVVHYEKLKFSLRIEEFTSIIDVTEHGVQRLIERGFTPADVKKVIYSPTEVKIQANGLKGYINQIENKFSVIILNENKRAVVTALKDIDKKALINLGKNYGW